MSHILRQLIREMKLIDELDSSRERASFKPHLFPDQAYSLMIQETH
jgi:hypothetical protein